MEADYAPESGYHEGSIAEQEARAHLGIFKSTSEVPPRYQLSNFAAGVDPEDVWSDFVDEVGDNWSENTLKYKYKSPWSKWCEFARDRGINPVTPTAEDLDSWFEEALEQSSTLATCHDVHFRVLFSVFEFVTERTDYPHKYNPVLQAALLGGVAGDLWEERVMRRKKYDHIEDKDER